MADTWIRAPATAGISGRQPKYVAGIDGITGYSVYYLPGDEVIGRVYGTSAALDELTSHSDVDELPTDDVAVVLTDHTDRTWSADDPPTRFAVTR